MLNRQIKFDILLLLIVLLLVVIGITMIYSASNFKAKEQYNDSNYFLKKQVIRVFIGLILMIIFLYVDYHDLQRLSWVILLFALLLLIYVLIGGIKVNGSRRAINLINFVFQPSELAKYALVLFLSWFLTRKGGQIKSFSNGLLPALIIIALTIIPILFEPDLGTAVIVFLIACVMLFVSEVNLYHLAALGISSITFVSITLLKFSYQKNRLLSFVNTIRGVKEPPWQVMQSLICFTNGGLWGIGLGNSRQKLHFLPQPFTDFIYAIISEETGFIGVFIVLLLFFALMWRGIWIAFHAPDKQGKLLAIGITATLIIYAYASIAIAINLMPITGIPMPFISYGGSALIMNFIAIGILLNISKQSRSKSYLNYAYSNMVTSQKRYRIKKPKRRKHFAR